MPAVQPKKTPAQKPVSKKAAPPAEVVAPAPVAEVAAKPARAPRTKKEKPAEAEKAAEPAEKKQRGPRREVSSESVASSFEELIKSVEDYVVELKNENGKGVKFLRSLNKKLKLLKQDAGRVSSKKSKKTSKPRANNGGFNKPVKISPEMSKFTGWESGKEYSRLDVTKFICAYIKQHNLQNPSDKRQIVCDTKLGNLLKYDAKTTGEPLTYFRIQRCLQPHFIKPVVVA